MILVISADADPMGARIATGLQQAGAEHIFLSVHDIPGEIRLSLSPQAERSALILPDGTRLEAGEISAIFHRVGFSNFQVYEELSDEEVRYVNAACQMALAPWLNSFPGLVINRPVDCGSNASKPYQISLIGEYGFAVPYTVVTNSPRRAREFYESSPYGVIFKSISYHRSIVKKMEPGDLERLETLRVCPVQLQGYVDGFDVRVHVVGDQVFASRIESGESDYRYDKSSEITPFELPDALVEQCLALSRALNLPLAGLDLRITPEDEVCCFEVNPSPAFSWYEDRTGQPITEAVVELLMGS